MPLPKKNVPYTFDVSLIDSANRPFFRANPTLATGDVKVKVDDTAYANLSTLPTVTPASGRNVKVSLTDSEMNGDRIVVQFVDAAGGEWDELQAIIITSANTLEDIIADTNDIQTKIGTPAGASVSADILVIDNLVDDLESRLGTPSNLGSGATVAANLVDIEGQTDDIGVAGAGLTALGDTRIANLDAAVSSRLAPVASGTSDSGSTTTMVDSARSEADTDYWRHALIVFTSGNIAGQARVITAFDPATDTITFAPATTQAVATQNYQIWPTGDFLRPTTSGRTLDVSTGGEAGVDWANVGTQGSSVNLSATTVNLVNTLTTYTGNTPQTGDAFARLGAPAGASVSADILAIDNFVDDLESRLGTPSNLGSGATISANLVDIEGQTDDIGVAGAGLTALGDTRIANLDATVSSRATPAQVNTEVLDVLNTDTFAEPGQEAPGATVSLVKKIGYLYKAFRNRLTQTSTTFTLYADDGTTVDQKATVSDNGTTFDRNEIVSGP